MNIEPTTGIVLGTFAVALVLCGVRAWGSRSNLNDRLGPANWDFNQSWASNLAAVGSILGIVIGASSSLPQANLGLTAIVLSIFFGALIIASPITYAALQVSVGETLEGTVWAFLVASGLTLWAALGEVVTAAAFFLDLREKLPWLIVGLFILVVVLAMIMLLRYAWLGTGWILSQAKPPVAAAREEKLIAWPLI